MTNKYEILENKCLEYKLNTGDLIFFYTERSTSNKLIEYFTDNETDGLFLTGMIIRDPWFTQQELSGLYLLYGFYDNSEDCFHEKKIDEYLLIKRSDKYQVKLSPLSEIFDEDNFNSGKDRDGRRNNIVVVNYAGQKAGLVVDELLGEHQTVIKPLGKIFQNLKGISGATILGSGEVAMIIDVPALVGRAV
jgi:hypothetical protein